MVKENEQAKEYIVNIKQIFSQYLQRLEEQNFFLEKYFQRPQKKYKKVVYEEETDSEPEADKKNLLDKKKKKNKNSFHLKEKLNILST